MTSSLSEQCFGSGSGFNEVNGSGFGFGPDPVTGGQKWPTKIEKGKKIHVFPVVNFFQFLVITWIRIGIQPKMLDPESYESGSETLLPNSPNSPCRGVYYITARLSRGMLVLHFSEKGRHPHQNVRLVAALWNRNYFFTVPVPTFEKLWFRFRFRFQLHI
jgi:hypothetical protein